MGSHGCGYGLADHNPQKTRTRSTGLAGLPRHMFAIEYIIVQIFLKFKLIFSYFLSSFLFYVMQLSRYVSHNTLQQLEQQHGDNGDNNNSYNSYDNNYDEDGNDKCWE